MERTVTRKLSVKCHEQNTERSENRLMALLYNRPWVRTVMKPLFLNTKKNHVLTHSIRVAELAVDMGEQAGLEEEYLDLLRLGGFLHDNGKKSIPSELLNGKKTLTIEEKMASFDPHPRWGFDALMEQSKYAHSWKEQKEIQQLAYLIVAHHEFKITKPYPRGNGRENGGSDDKIILLQQILALADYIESRTDGEGLRKYNRALPFKEALSAAQNELSIDPSLFDCARELRYSVRLRKNITHYLESE